jgi:hypothetical protein
MLCVEMLRYDVEMLTNANLTISASHHNNNKHHLTITTFHKTNQ